MKLKTLLNIELIVAILIIILGILGLDVYQAGYISYFFMVLLLVLIILETTKFNKNCTIRITVIAVGLLTGVVLFFSKDISILSLGEYLGVVNTLFGLGIMISLFVVKAKCSRVILEENSDESIKNGKKYPLGYLSSGTLLIFRLISIVYILGGVVLGLSNIDNWLYVVIYLFSGFLVLFGYIILKTQICDLKWFRKFYNDLDYESLESNIKKQLSNPKIHPETYNYYLIFFVSATSFFDKDKYLEMKKNLFEPTVKAYKFFYDMLSLDFIQDYESFENNVNILKNKYKNKKAYLNKIEMAYQTGLAFYTGNNTKLIDSICPTNTKNNFINCGNFYNKIFYYKNKNDFVKVEELKKEFNEKYFKAKRLLEEINNINYGESYEEN